MFDQRYRLLVAVARFRTHASRIFAAADECTDRDEAIELYTEVYDLVREVQGMLDVVATRLLTITPIDERWTPIPLPGSGVLKFGGGKEAEVFEGDRIIAEYSERIASNLKDTMGLRGVVTEEGEVLEDETFRKMIHAVAHRMAAATGALAPSFKSWRTGPAKELGLNIKKYATMKDAPWTVRIEGRDRSE